MITSGGFGANFDMIKQYDPKLADFKTTNAPGALGEGIVMAEQAGAALVDMEYIQIHPTTIPGQGVLITEGVRGDGAILVNEDGQRFTNELLTRDVVSQNILAQNGKHAYLIFTDKLVENNHATEAYFKQNLVKEGSTVEELAGQINVDPANLAETVNQYNGYVKNNKDEQFGRESMKLSFEQGSYYAIEVTPGIHHTMGGIVINAKSQVLDKDGNVIPNLFAAGEVTGASMAPTVSAATRWRILRHSAASVRMKRSQKSTTSKKGSTRYEKNIGIHHRIGACTAARRRMLLFRAI